MPEDLEAIIDEEVTNALSISQELTELEQQLSQNEQFRRFLELSKTAPAKIQAMWDLVEAQMIEHGIKSIKGDWGSLTIAERLNWDYDPTMLPAKFFRKVVDTKKLSDTYRLEGKAPKGATPKYTKYLTKRLK